MFLFWQQHKETTFKEVLKNMYLDKFEIKIIRGADVEDRVLEVRTVVGN
jgi:hypothetical protein